MSAAAHAFATAPALAAPVTVPRDTPRRAVTTPPAYTPFPNRTRKELGDPTPLVCTVARIALEVVLGADGINQLVRWISPEVRSRLLIQHSLSRRSGYTAKGSVHIQRVRLCRVSPDAVEASVVATEGDLVHAIAIRLEAVSNRWLITVMDVG